MSSSGVTPFLRRATYFAVPTLIALYVGICPIASAQSTDNFSSSSTQELVASDGSSGVSALPALGTAVTSSANPIAGQERSYGYHQNRYVSRLAFEGGGGFNAPIGNDQPFITWGGNITLGGGLRLQKHISVLAEYQFLDNKLPGGLIAEAGAQGGHSHIWSLTLDPVIDFFPDRKNSIYVTGGGGFYRKVTSFTDPQEIEICYYFCEIGVENVVVSHFSSNQGGANFGIGFTHKLGGDEHLKAFAEARYLWIDTPAIGEQDGLGKTELIPVTFGVRW
jgi:hypothetical protein